MRCSSFHRSVMAAAVLVVASLFSLPALAQSVAGPDGRTGDPSGNPVLTAGSAAARSAEIIGGTASLLPRSVRRPVQKDGVSSPAGPGHSVSDVSRRTWLASGPTGATSVGCLLPFEGSQDTFGAGLWLAGFMKTVDGGRTWTPFNKGLPVQEGGHAFSDLTARPGTDSVIFAGVEYVASGTGSPGVYRSLNGGESWHLAGLAGMNVQNLVIPDSSPMTVYAGTDANGVHRSTDGGDTWNPMSLGLTYGWHIRLAVDPFDPEGDRILAATDSGMYISTDGGGSWTPANTGITDLTLIDVCAVPQVQDMFFTVAFGGKVFRTDDGGATWTELPALASPSPVSGSVRAHALAAGRIYVGTIDGVFVSHDYGATWDLLLEEFVFQALEPSPFDGEVAYVGNDAAGIIYIMDLGTPATATWELPTALAQDVCANPVYPERVYCATSRGVWKSGDGGKSWQATASVVPPGWIGASTHSLAVDDVTGSVILGGGQNAFFQGFVIKTVDEGDNWTTILSSGGLVYALAVKPGTDDFFLAGDWNGTGYGSWGAVRISTDGGGSWTQTLYGPAVSRASYCAADPNRVYLATNDGVYRSDDGGFNWRRTWTGVSTSYVLAVAAHPSDSDAAVAGTYGYWLGGSWQPGQGVFVTRDAGANWTPLNNGLGCPEILDVSFSDDALYAGTWGGGVYMRRFGAPAWRVDSAGLFNDVVYAVEPLRLGRFRACAGTYGNGVFYR